MLQQVFTKTFRNCQRNKGKRFSIHQGGSRSGKTYAILQYIIWLCYINKNRGAIITICRETLTALRGTAMRDFFEILRNLNIYEVENHSKSTNEYNLFGNLIEFIGVDDEQKVRGRKRHLLYINEANEVSYDKFVQLNMRTVGRVIIDYNPSEVFWSEDIRTNFPNDVEFFVTTYRDNPTLAKAIVEQIENYKTTSPNYLWQIYGLGNFAMREGLVFENAKYIQDFPTNFDKFAYAMDFGYSNDPTVLLACGLHNGELHTKELIYEKGLLTDNLISRMNDLGLQKNVTIYADCNDPRMIDELRYKGKFNVKAVKKGKDSIEFGLSEMLKYQWNINGTNTWKERNNYVWATKNGIKTNVGVGIADHSIDAARYFVMEELAAKNVTKRTLTTMVA